MSRLKSATHPFTIQRQAILSDYVSALAWPPDGQWLAAASAAGEVLMLSTSGPTQTLQSPQTESVSCLSFSADGQFLATAGQAGRVRLWRRQPLQWALVSERSHSGVWIDQLAWHPKQNLLAYGVNSQIKLWDVEAEKLLGELDFEASSVLHLAWRPKGTALAVGGHGGVKVWPFPLAAQEPILMAVPGASLFTAWSHDGRYLASGNLDRTLTVMQWHSPPPWFMQGFPGRVRHLSWSMPTLSSGVPLLAAACAEGITVWERTQGKSDIWQSRVLHHHQDVVEMCAFQPRSLLLASAGWDGVVCFWSRGKRLAQILEGFSQGVSTLAWQPTGAQLAAGGAAGEIIVWG